MMARLLLSFQIYSKQGRNRQLGDRRLLHKTPTVKDKRGSMGPLAVAHERQSAGKRTEIKDGQRSKKMSERGDWE